MSKKDRLVNPQVNEAELGNLAQLIELYRFSPACVVFIDHDDRLISVNKMGLCLLEVDDFSELQNILYTELIDHAHLAEFRRVCAKARAGGSGVLELNYKGRCGARHLHEAHISAIRTENDKVEALLCVSTDYSVRKELTVALHESEHRFRLLSDSIPQQIWTATNDGYLSYINKRAGEYFGIGESEILTRGWQSLCLIDDLPMAEKAWAQSMATGNHLRIDLRLRRADGEYCWHFVQAMPVFDQDGEILEWFGSNTDISERKLVEAALQESETLLALAQENANLGSWYNDLRRGRVKWSDQMFRIYGLSLDSTPLLFIETLHWIHPDDRGYFSKKYEEALTVGANYSIDVRLENQAGVVCWIEARCELIRDKAGEISSLRGTVQDITVRKLTEQKLLQTKRLLDESQRLAKVGGWELDIATNNLYWTAETYRILETRPGEINLSANTSIALYAQESRDVYKTAMSRAINDGVDFDLELEIFTAKGRKIDIRTTCIVTKFFGKVTKLTGMFQDITETKNIQRQAESANRGLAHANSVLEHIAHYDALTRLPNRTLLADRMQQAMKVNQRQGHSMAVAFLDLDGFKEVNDTYGHAAGDELLISISLRMKNSLRACDTLARIGGDEFVVMLSDLKSIEDCERLLSLLLKAVARPLDLGGHQLQVSASIGVTLYPQDSVDAEQLLRHADQAMYLAKQAGKNCIHIFDVEKDTAVKNQQEELEKIKQAFIDEQFCLFYQPKINMKTGLVIGAEALIRWRHPERGLLLPAVFLPVVEDSIFSVTLGEWVIEEALRQMEEWQRSGLFLPVSVNVGALQLQRKNFVQRLENILKKFPSRKANSLELEILETSALDDISQLTNLLIDCQKLGVTFSLDDFGTGYSSLTYLKRLPAETLKIDRSFIRDMLIDSDDYAIVEGIIGLASAFERKVIAEGVESSEHGAALLKMGCIYAQGYGIARPMCKADIPGWVDEWHRQPRLIVKV